MKTEQPMCADRDLIDAVAHAGVVFVVNRNGRVIHLSRNRVASFCGRGRVSYEYPPRVGQVNKRFRVCKACAAWFNLHYARQATVTDELVICDRCDNKFPPDDVLELADGTCICEACDFYLTLSHSQ